MLEEEYRVRSTTVSIRSALRYQRIAVPYGRYHLNAVYYPGPAGSERRNRCSSSSAVMTARSKSFTRSSSPQLLYKHGYSVLTYEGPGQGSVIREQGLTFRRNGKSPTARCWTHFSPRIRSLRRSCCWAKAWAVISRRVPQPSIRASTVLSLTTHSTTAMRSPCAMCRNSCSGCTIIITTAR